MKRVFMFIALLGTYASAFAILPPQELQANFTPRQEALSSATIQSEQATSVVPTYDNTHQRLDSIVTRTLSYNNYAFQSQWANPETWKYEGNIVYHTKKCSWWDYFWYDWNGRKPAMTIETLELHPTGERLLSTQSYSYQWNEDHAEPMLESETKYQYDGKWVYSLSYKRQEGHTELTLESEIKSEYNEDGKCISEQRFDADGYSYFSEYTYYPYRKNPGDITITLYHNENYKKSVHLYETEGMNDELENATYEWKENEWIVSSGRKKETIYLDGRNYSFTYYTAIDNQWVPSRKYEHTYSDSLSNTWVGYTWEENQWVLSSKGETTYSDRWNHTSIGYEWKEESWIPLRKDIYHYDGISSISVTYNWQEDKWIPYYKYEIYQDNSNLFSYCEYYWVNHEWSLYRKTKSYSDDECTYYEDGDSYWDSDGNLIYTETNEQTCTFTLQDDHIRTWTKKREGNIHSFTYITYDENYNKIDSIYGKNTDPIATQYSYYKTSYTYNTYDNLVLIESFKDVKAENIYRENEVIDFDVLSWDEPTSITTYYYSSVESSTDLPIPPSLQPVTQKVLENGTIYILRQGEKYTLDGRRVK